MPGTEISRSETAALLANWPVGALIDVAQIPVGTINTSFDVTTEHGRYCLRVNEDKGATEVTYESDLIAELAARGVSTPAPLVTAAGARQVWLGERAVNLFPWIEGEHREPDRVTAADAVAVGAALAGLHTAAAELGDRFGRESDYGMAELTRRYRSFADSSNPRLGAAIAEIGDALAAIGAEGERRAALPQIVIHGDLFPDNVLFDDSAVVALLDFEQAATGAPLYDLAVCINAWCAPAGRLDRELVGGMVGGYLGARDLAELDAESLFIECSAAAVRFAITRITDVYLPGLALAGKDFGEFLALMAGWRANGIAWLEPVL